MSHPINANSLKTAEATAKRVYSDILEMQRTLNVSRPQQERLIREAKANLDFEQNLERFIDVSWAIGEAAAFSACGLRLVKLLGDATKAYLAVESLETAARAAIVIKVSSTMIVAQGLWKSVVIGKFNVEDAKYLFLTTTINGVASFLSSSPLPAFATAAKAVRVAAPLTFATVKAANAELDKISKEMDANFANKARFQAFAAKHGKIAQSTDIPGRKWEAFHLFHKYTAQLKATKNMQVATHALQQIFIKLFEPAAGGGLKLHALIRELDKYSSTLKHSPNQQQINAMVVDLQRKVGL